MSIGAWRKNVMWVDRHLLVRLQGDPRISERGISRLLNHTGAEFCEREEPSGQQNQGFHGGLPRHMIQSKSITKILYVFN